MRLNAFLLVQIQNPLNNLQGCAHNYGVNCYDERCEASLAAILPLAKRLVTTVSVTAIKLTQVVNNSKKMFSLVTPN